MITSIEQLLTEINQDRTPKTTITPPRRTRWSKAEESLLAQLIARFGTDYQMLGNFLPRKTARQIRKKQRFLQQRRPNTLQRLEEELHLNERKNYFDSLLESSSASSLPSSRLSSSSSSSSASQSDPCEQVEQFELNEPRSLPDFQPQSLE